MNTALKSVLAAVLMSAGLAACEKPVVAPDDKGVCWHVIQQKDGKLKFNKLESNVANMETCAARLEGMRIRFARLGVNNPNLLGAYQANFIFINPEGIFVARNMSSARYLSLVRSGDGRLVVPGAMQVGPNLPPLSTPEVTAPSK